MRLPRFGRDRSVQFNVTPLIDVVFLLIVFFLVSSHLAQQETQMELSLPNAASGHEALSIKTPRVTINLLPNGRLFLGSEEVLAAEIYQRLGVERKQTAGELEVRIRADRSVAYRHVEPLLLACARAQIWNVSFAIEESRTAYGNKKIPLPRREGLGEGPVQVPTLRIKQNLNGKAGPSPRVSRVMGLPRKAGEGDFRLRNLATKITKEPWSSLFTRNATPH